MVLHLVSRSPFTSSCLQDCLRLAADEDSLLLIGDGVYAALNDARPLQSHRFAAIYALADDVASRGLGTSLPQAIEVIDYDRFVSLCCEADRTLSWY